MPNQWLVRRCPAVVALVMLLALPPHSLAAQSQSLFWGDLTPGPYAVGFETVEKYDYSRVFRDKYNYDGDFRPGETARPIQICIWYPASRLAESSPMVYAEYAFPTPQDTRFYGLLANLQGREIGYLFTILRGNRGLIQDIMNLPVEAAKSAVREEGSFPLIIYHPDGRSGFSENAVMCEFLASHGFVVATSHVVGSVTLNQASNPVGLETMVRDREFVYGFMRDYPNVDNSKPGVAGAGMGALAALLMQMRNTDIEAVATLNASYDSKDNLGLAVGFAFFDIAKMDVPLLHLYMSDAENVDLSVTDSLRYSRRHMVGLKGFAYDDFTQYSVISSLAPDTSAAEVTAPSKYPAVCQCVLRFFEHYLKGGETGGSFLPESILEPVIGSEAISAVVIEKEQVPPSELQFVEMIQEDKIQRAAEIYKYFKTARPGYVFFQEATLNALGYQLLQGNRLGDALAVFKINAEAFPNSANVWDSYADACIASGETETAITCYKKVLEVLPADSAVGPQVREILQNNATQGLQTLQGQ